jgi:hypothetical protein
MAKNENPPKHTEGTETRGGATTPHDNMQAPPPPKGVKTIADADKQRYETR